MAQKKVRVKKQFIEKRRYYLGGDEVYSHHKKSISVTYIIDESIADTTVSYNQILDSYNEYKNNCNW